MPDSDSWPPAADHQTVILALASTPVEVRLIEAFVDQVRAAAPGAGVTLARHPAEAISLAKGDDAVIAPVKVVWLPPDRNGRRRFLLRDLLSLGDPSRPGTRVQERVLRSSPDRCSLVVGEPARYLDLVRRWSMHTGRDGDDQELGGFVGRQARRAVDHSERTMSGSGYKTAEDVADDLVASQRFRNAATALAESLGRDPQDVLAEARRCFGEMATVQNRFARDVWAQLARFMWGRAYHLDVDESALEKIRELGRRQALVFLPSHKSNLDSFVMSSTLYECGFPANHVMGGNNMSFWPMGALGRRVGVVFIRRSFGGDEVYKLALRHYLAYLASKRLNLEWYIEGGRSRTGKLLPPRMGLLNYLARGVEEVDVPEVYLVPVSIVYERLNEVAQMTSESRGAKKQPEGLKWMLGYIHSQRGRLGRIQVHFAEPVALRSALRAEAKGERSLALSKVAFEVCTRINRSTPVTPTSLATLALLGADGWAVTLAQTIALVRPLRDYVTKRNLPGAEDIAEMATPAGMGHVLRSLADSGVVDEFAGGAEPVFRISPERELVAAFYRNVIIHWFVNRAIVELALVAAAEAPGADPMGVAVDDALRLRDLLKFEFFFAEKAQFQRELRAEVDLIAPQWRADDGAVVSTLGESIAASGGLVADRVLRSFLEAYWVVADRLVAAGDRIVETDEFVASCLAVGRQYQLQRRIVSAEAISVELFTAGLKLATNRGLCDQENPDRKQGRVALAAELHDAMRRLELLTRWERRHRLRRQGDRGSEPAAARGHQAMPA
ncbi:MAG: glycerol-3-phosphate 1-O-acyltransferase [Actinomycetota bacterium]|nr:glycerol-3-phosphate 1-O-acyltransferase [Actinomycetota bacterium]